MKKLLCTLILLITTVGFVRAQADIEIVGNSTIIVDGQTAINTSDDTDFGSTPIGIPVIHQFTINNTGDALLFVGLPAFNDLGTGTSDWSSTNPNPPFLIGAGGSSTFDVTFNPSVGGAQTVEISLLSSDSDESPYTFNVGGIGTVPSGPEIEIVGNSTIIVDGQTAISTTDDTDFGSTPVGTPVLRQFTINNTGTTDLFINIPLSINDLGTGTADFSTTDPAFQVPALSSTTFDVTFNPSSAGAQTVEIFIVSNDVDENPFTYNIGGTGIVPSGPDVEIVGNGTIIVDGQTVINISDDTDFGSTPVGTPVLHQFTINNTGTSDLFIGIPTFNDLGTGTSDWSSTNPTPPFLVAAGGSSTFDITFNPSSSGLQTVEISLISSDPDENPFTFNVGGTGTLPVEPDIEVVGNGAIIVDGQTVISTTDDTDYGQTPIGTPVVHQFTINNTGTSDLFISIPPSINDLGTGTSDFSTTDPAFQVPALGTTTFDVTFNPSTLGIQTVEISLASNDPDENPFTFVIGGEGIAAAGPEMDVFGLGNEIADGDVTPNLADDTDYGQVDVVTGSASHTFTIENNGSSDLNLTDPDPFVTLSGDVSDFSVNARPPFPIAPAGSSDFVIEFNPTTVGIRTVTVSIGNNDSDEDPYTFVIQGEGTDANADSPLLITQYYEGVGNDKWIEVKNISVGTIVINGEYVLALYTGSFTLQGTINTTAPQQSTPIGTMLPGDVRLFRNPSAVNPVNLGSAAITPTNVCTFNGADVILISKTSDATCYDNRTDIMGVVELAGSFPPNWGQDLSFIKGCGTNEQPSLVFDTQLVQGTLFVNDYIELALAEVDNADPTTNIALGSQGVGPTTWTTSWDNESPDRTRDVIINGNYNGSAGSLESCNLTVAGTLDFDNGTSNFVTVNEDLIIGGTFTLGDSESLFTVNALFPFQTGDIIGSITKIESSTSLVNINDFTYWSSPVQGATIASVFSNANLNRVYYWDQAATSLFDGGDVGDPTIVFGEWLPASGTMTRVRGYISEGPISGSYPQEHTVLFTGTPNNGTLGLGLVWNNDGNAFSDYNLVGNPYPSAIDADAFINSSDNSSIDGTIYLWTHNTQNNGNPIYQYTTDDYATYNLSGGVAAGTGGAVPTSNIGSGQGFMVRAISNGQVVFNNTMRLRDQNTQFFRGTETKSATAEEKDRIWLNVESSDGGAFNQILIGFFEGATDGHDRGYDGIKNGASWISFYSNIDTLRYAIQGLSSFSMDKRVSLGFDTYISDPLSYKISIHNIEGVLNSNDIYLVDNLLNITHDLKQADYEFDVDGVGYFEDRFTLQFTKSTLGVGDLELDNNFVVINEDNGLRLRSNSVITNIKVYDITGRLLVDDKPNDNEYNINTQKIGQGTVLILNATFDNGAVVSKKAIRY